MCSAAAAHGTYGYKPNKDIISISGRAGSGKDTLAGFIRVDLGHHHVSLAQDLKLLAMEIMERPLDKGRDRWFLVDLAEYLKGNRSRTEINDKYAAIYPRLHNKVIVFLLARKLLENYYYTQEFWGQNLVQSFVKDSKYVVSDARYNADFIALSSVRAVKVLIDVDEATCASRLHARDGAFDSKIWQSPSEREHRDQKYDIVISGTITEQLSSSVYGGGFRVRDKTPEEIYAEFQQKLEAL